MYHPNRWLLLLLLSRFSRMCDPIDNSPPGSPVPGILQARTLEWGATMELLSCKKEYNFLEKT